MQVSSYDVCIQGFERLRTQSEVLLPVIIGPKTTLNDIAEDLRSELVCCDRGDSFDYKAAGVAINDLIENHLQWLFKKDNPWSLEEPTDDNDEPVYLFVYLDTEQ